MRNEFKIENVETYGLEQSIIASGYPMKTEISCEDSLDFSFTEEKANDTRVKRAITLGTSKPGSGHDCYLKGIIVQMDLTAPQYMWKQLQRYHWLDFISSQSTMHRITKMDITSQCNEYVDERIIDILKLLIEDYNGEATPEKFQIICANIPSGLMLSARMTTNYLQLKTIYNQRKSHKLKEWKLFCEWCESLPYFKEFCVK